MGVTMRVVFNLAERQRRGNNLNATRASALLRVVCARECFTAFRLLPR